MTELVCPPGTMTFLHKLDTSLKILSEHVQMTNGKVLVLETGLQEVRQLQTELVRYTAKLENLENQAGDIKRWQEEFWARFMKMAAGIIVLAGSVIGGVLALIHYGFKV